MTSSNTFPNKWTKIDELLRRDHRHLTEQDRCYFLGKYTAGAGFEYSPINSVISNFKKSMDRKDRPEEWRHKERATLELASSFKRAFGTWTNGFTFVPVPPSRSREDPLYDDRLVRMLGLVQPRPALDIRDMVTQVVSSDPSHLGGTRDPKAIASLYTVDARLLGPTRPCIAIVDDVLTTGAHYRAMKVVLADYFPGVPILGFFLTRSVRRIDDERS